MKENGFKKGSCRRKKSQSKASAFTGNASNSKPRELKNKKLGKIEKSPVRTTLDNWSVVTVSYITDLELQHTENVFTDWNR